MNILNCYCDIGAHFPNRLLLLRLYHYHGRCIFARHFFFFLMINNLFCISIFWRVRRSKATATISIDLYSSAFCRLHVAAAATSTARDIKQSWQKCCWKFSMMFFFLSLQSLSVIHTQSDSMWLILHRARMPINHAISLRLFANCRIFWRYTCMCWCSSEIVTNILWWRMYSRMFSTFMPI